MLFVYSALLGIEEVLDVCYSAEYVEESLWYGMSFVLLFKQLKKSLGLYKRLLGGFLVSQESSLLAPESLLIMTPGKIPANRHSADL